VPRAFQPSRYQSAGTNAIAFIGSSGRKYAASATNPAATGNQTRGRLLPRTRQAIVAIVNSAISGSVMAALGNGMAGGQSMASARAPRPATRPARRRATSSTRSPVTNTSSPICVRSIRFQPSQPGSPLAVARCWRTTRVNSG
jgi:hypothetical protein